MVKTAKMKITILVNCDGHKAKIAIFQCKKKAVHLTILITRGNKFKDEDEDEDEEVGGGEGEEGEGILR